VTTPSGMPSASLLTLSLVGAASNSGMSVLPASSWARVFP
jgi:hypothetical protein